MQAPDSRETIALQLARGAAVWVWDSEDRKLFDAQGDGASPTVGHRHPRVLRALDEQAGRLTSASPEYPASLQGAWERKLAEIATCELARCTASGAAALAAARAAARAWAETQRGIAEQETVILEVAASSTESRPRPVFGDVHSLRTLIDERTAAVQIEPVFGESVLVPPPGYLDEVRGVCNETGVLLICDERRTGLGRTGASFAFEHDGIVPDLLVLGDALCGGILPAGAVCGEAGVLELLSGGALALAHSSGSALAAAVGLATLAITIEEDLAARAREQGEWLLGELSRVAPSGRAVARGQGLLIGIEIAGGLEAAQTFHGMLLDLGILAPRPRNTVAGAATLRLAPPLVAERADLEWALERITTAFGGL